MKSQWSSTSLPTQVTVFIILCIVAHYKYDHSSLSFVRSDSETSRRVYNKKNHLLSSLVTLQHIYIYIYIVTISKAIVIYLLPFYLQQFLLYLFISQIIICICFINLFIFQYNISLFFSLCTNDYIYIIIKLSFPFSTASTSLLSIRQLTPRVSLINTQTKQI